MKNINDSTMEKDRINNERNKYTLTVNCKYKARTEMYSTYFSKLER